jgi:hypothetical protein
MMIFPLKLIDTTQDKGYTNLGDWLGTGFAHHPNISIRPELSCKSGVSGLVSQRFQL